MSINFGKTEVIGKSKFAPVYIARRRIDVETLEHTDAREIGAEWLCLQAVRQLRVEGFLCSLGWTEEDVKIAIAHLITHTIYTPSELKSMRIMQGQRNVMIGVRNNEVVYVPLSEAIRSDKPFDKKLITVLEELSI